MFAAIKQSCRFSASFLLSKLSTDMWIALIAGAAAVALLGAIIAGLALHAAVVTSNLIIAATVLCGFATILGTGIYCNGDHHSNSNQDETFMMSTFGNI